jgi:hypothetical protein
MIEALGLSLKPVGMASGMSIESDLPAWIVWLPSVIVLAFSAKSLLSAAG